jgi:DNA polymerase-3 subunit delta'
VLAIPASLTSLAACFQAAEHLVSAAEGEASALTAELDVAESDELSVALGSGGTGKGAAASARSGAAALRELERRQKSRATRLQRDALDRALVDLASFYRDVLLVQSGSSQGLSHPDVIADVRTVAQRTDQPGALRRLEYVLVCRQAIEENVKPRIAVEAMTACLQLL